MKAPFISTMSITNIKEEKESQTYGACRFNVGNYVVVYRTAHVTPTKIGQFVTLWKRDQKDGPIAPLDMNDDFDVVVLAVRHEKKGGYFIFPKNILRAQKIISVENKGGIRAMRLYPPWDKPTSQQALRTQAWQLKYFHSDDNDIGKIIASLA